MKEIALTRGKVALVDDEEYEFLNQWKWFAREDKNNFYAIRNEHTTLQKSVYQTKTIYMHRLILGIENPKILVDHKDHNGLNNQKSNIRTSTNQQNSCNKKKHAKASSKYKGVSWHKGICKWHSQIYADGKKKSLGYYPDEKKAADSYNIAARYYHKEFASLNVL